MNPAHRREWIVAGLAFTLTGVMLAGLGLVVGPAALYLCFPPVVLFSYAARAGAGPRGRAIAGGLILGATATFVARGAHVVVTGIRDLEEWDFQAFWVWGRAAAMGLNPYLPDSIAQASAAAGLSPSQLFVDQVLGAGFPYPPPTMLLLWPFALFSLRTGIVLWYLFHVGCLVGCIGLLWRLLFPGSGWPGLAVVTAMLVGIRSTQTTLHLAQTNFLLLLTLLLYWRTRAKFQGGLWLAAGMAVKPWVAILLLLPLVRRRFRVLVGAVAGTLGLFVTAALVFGPSMVESYLRLPAVAQMPTRYFSSVVNQSLLATILRFSAEKHSVHLDPRQSPTALLLFVAIAGALTIATLLLAHRLPPGRDDLAFCLNVLLALMVYPGTLYHYGMMVLAPLLWMWARREELRLPTAAATAIVTVPFVLIGSSHAKFVFPGIAFTWLAFAVIAWRAAGATRAPAPPDLDVALKVRSGA